MCARASYRPPLCPQFSGSRAVTTRVLRSNGASSCKLYEEPSPKLSLSCRRPDRVLVSLAGGPLFCLPGAPAFDLAGISNTVGRPVPFDSLARSVAQGRLLRSSQGRVPRTRVRYFSSPLKPNDAEFIFSHPFAKSAKKWG